MLIGILALVTALAISGVAIYYSVAGLVAIFAAAAIPIMIMGGVLEVSKLVTAVWLHRNWHIATWWLKTYLSTAVVVLMFITSMGIFGFLSKAHIEQTAGAQQGLAQIEQIDERLEYNQEIIASSESKIDELQNSGSTVENSIRDRIAQEQERIDTAYDKIQPAVQEQREIIARQTALYQTQIDNINRDLERLQGYIENDEIRKAQAVVGTTVDGDYGPATARAFNDYQEQKTQEREQLISRVQTSLDNNTTVQRARTEISNLQSRAASQVADAERAIQQLRERLNSNTGSNIETLIAQQNTRIQEASASVETLTDKKFDLESEYRQLEAEVGPLRYIAEFIYGDEAGTDLLEKAVQWVIVIIIFVFDPLAVLLLIASQYSLQAGHNYNRRKEDFMDTVTSKGDVAKPRNVRVVERRSSTKNVAEEPEQQKEEPQSAELSAEELDTSYDVSDEFIKSREEQYKEKEKDETFAKNKTDWKKENPNETLKHYKKLYTHGVIDSLPWE
jgi:hypothetical protein